MASQSEKAALQPGPVTARFNAWLCGVLGYFVLAAAAAGALSLLTWNIADPSLTHAASGPVHNQLGPVGAIVSDLIMQLFGLAGVMILLPPIFWALQLIGMGRLERPRTKLLFAPAAVILLACAASSLPKLEAWPMPHNIGGLLGDFVLAGITSVLATIRPERASAVAGLFSFAGGMALLSVSLGLSKHDFKVICQAPQGVTIRLAKEAWRRLGEMSERASISRREPVLRMPGSLRPVAPAFEASAFEASPAARGFVPEPRPFAPQPSYPIPEMHRLEPTIDGELEREKLDRILEICAPESVSKLPSDRELPKVVMRAEPDEMPRPYRIVEPKPRAPEPVAPPRDVIPRPHKGPCWSVPEPAPARPPLDPPSNGWRPQSAPGGDDLYGQAVMIVLDDRKPSATYLQQRLKIGYMRASDLIDRMEREGILGVPVYKGLRPILIGGSGSREV